jgi:hypothetical protein
LATVTPDPGPAVGAENVKSLISTVAAAAAGGAGADPPAWP